MINAFFESGDDDRDLWYKENRETFGKRENKVASANTTAIISPFITNNEVIQEPSSSILPQVTVQTPQLTNSPTYQFTISDIVLGQSYDGYIKLQFNYGLFVTVK